MINTAKEARQLSEKVSLEERKTRAQRDFMTLLLVIESRALTGESSISLNYQVGDFLKKLLEDAGFKIKVGSTNNYNMIGDDNTTLISWG